VQNKKKNLAERNKKYRKRLAGTKCQVQKILDDGIESIRLENKLFHKQEAVRNERELARRNKALKKRLAGATGRDTKSLNDKVEAKRIENEKARRKKVKSKKKELEIHQARLQKLVKEAKSPIGIALAYTT